MAKRKSITKTLRFEIFKRDSFTCMYCGSKAPDVLLEIDHINPVSKGGTNDILNLITACKACNAGKSDKKLSESTQIEKQRLQLEELQERREQLDMMFQWQKNLLNLENDEIDQISQFWSKIAIGFSLNLSGIQTLKKLRKEYSTEEITSAMKIAAVEYFKYEENKLIHRSVEIGWGKIGGICKLNQIKEEIPDIKRTYYIRGILKNRLNYVDEQLAIKLMKNALQLNANIEWLEELSKQVQSWTAWKNEVTNFINEELDGNNPPQDD